MTKILKAYRLDPVVVKKIDKLSNESVRFIGRHVSRTAIVEIAIKKLFVNREKEMSMRLLDLDNQREILVNELERLIENKELDSP